MKHVMMIANDTNFVWNLRREVLQKLISEGYKVTLVAQVLGFKDQLASIGCGIIDINPGRHGTNPLADLKLLKTYSGLIKKEKPDLVLTNNIKPNIYAGLVCRSRHIRYMPNVCGLGTPVENPGPMQKLTSFLYKIGIKGCSAIFFQNSENVRFFEEHRMIPSNAKVVLLPGSGVNLETYKLLPWPEGPVHFLYAARIMKQKGIDLFLAAARKYASDEVVFDVCGQCDDEHYQAILQNEKSIQYHGLQKEMTSFYERCSCFLYPSYYPEGMSNVLLEAAACGRPVVAADRSGCRETADNGVTGFVVPVNDEDAVIDAVGRFLKLSKEEREEMGKRGRQKMKKQFDRNIVVDTIIREINCVIS